MVDRKKFLAEPERLPPPQPGGDMSRTGKRSGGELMRWMPHPTADPETRLTKTDTLMNRFNAPGTAEIERVAWP